MPVKDTRPVIEIFESKIARDFNGCWVWKSATDRKGYGMMRTTTRKYHRAHRLSYQFYVGKIPKGLFILHKCDVRNCVNPDHLYAGNQKQNIRDMIDRNRANPQRGEKSGRAKLTEKQVRFIKEKSIAYHPKFGRAALGRKFGIVPSAITEILTGHNWRHL